MCCLLCCDGQGGRWRGQGGAGAPFPGADGSGQQPGQATKTRPVQVCGSYVFCLIMCLKKKSSGMCSLCDFNVFMFIYLKLIYFNFNMFI